jgi:xanthine dehydrogenase YagR molybdenum-binding subunit
MNKDQKAPAAEHAIGRPISRVDGRLKVTGGTRYAAEAQVADVLYGVLVTSTIARGKLTTIDMAAAEKAPGVVAVLTHRNMPRIPGRQEVPGTPDPSVGRPLQPLQDDTIYHNGQPIAVVVADTFERATQAAALVRTTYREERAVTEFAAAAKNAVPPTEPKATERNPQTTSAAMPTKRCVRPRCGSRRITRSPRSIITRWSRTPRWRSGTDRSSRCTRRRKGSI